MLIVAMGEEETKRLGSPFSDRLQGRRIEVLQSLAASCLPPRKHLWLSLHLNDSAFPSREHSGYCSWNASFVVFIPQTLGIPRSSRLLGILGDHDIPSAKFKDAEYCFSRQSRNWT
jgi:hypothetical protein